MEGQDAFFASFFLSLITAIFAKNIENYGKLPRQSYN